MKTASFVVLLLVGVATLALSLLSTVTAYTREFNVGPISVGKIEALAPGAGPALRGARGTAAAFAAAYGVLWIVVVLGPYRRGETWAWWALLGATLVLAVVILLRVPLAGARAGVGTALASLVLVLLGLALDLGRLGRGRP
jgi:hypothetical protein